MSGEVKQMCIFTEILVLSMSLQHHNYKHSVKPLFICRKAASNVNVNHIAPAILLSRANMKVLKLTLFEY